MVVVTDRCLCQAGGYDISYNSTITVKDPRGGTFESVRPSEIFEPLLGYKKKQSERIDLNPHATRVVVLLSSVRKDWTLSIIPGGDMLASAVDQSKIICIVKTTKYWVATTLTFGANEAGVVQVSELIILNPLG